ncbi:MAG: hypothetical protein ACK55I_30475, partial [bacterium]
MFHPVLAIRFLDAPVAICIEQQCLASRTDLAGEPIDVDRGVATVDVKIAGDRQGEACDPRF